MKKIPPVEPSPAMEATDLISKVQFKTTRLVQKFQRGRRQKQAVQELQRCLMCHEAALLYIASPDDDRLFTAGADKVIRLWERKEGVFQFSRDSGILDGVVVGKMYTSENVILSTWQVYDFETKEFLLWGLQKGTLQQVQWIDEDRALVLYSTTSSICLALVNSAGKLTRMIHEGRERIAAFAGSDDIIAFSTAGSPSIAVVNTEGPVQQWQFQANNGKGVTKLLFLSAEQRAILRQTHTSLISCGKDSSVVAYTIADGRARPDQTVYVGDTVLNAWLVADLIVVSLPDVLKFYPLKDITASRTYLQTKAHITALTEAEGMWIAGDAEGGCIVFQALE